MIGRILFLIVAFALGALLVMLAVVNRHEARLVLDPFTPKAPVIYVDGQFFIFLFTMLIVGILIGGIATWMTQGKWRRVARVRTQEAMRWKAEAERLTRERDQSLSQKGGASSGATKLESRPLAIAGR